MEKKKSKQMPEASFHKILETHLIKRKKEKKNLSKQGC